MIPTSWFHWRFDGGLHFEEPPSPMGLDLDGGLHLDDPPSPKGDAFDGGLHFDDPPSPITAMAIK
jgi:hypothetical protein